MTTYHLDPALSQIAFEVRHAMITRVRGLFTDVEATVVNDTVQATIAVASLDSGVRYRDGR